MLGGIETLISGGWVVYPLVLLNFLLWWAMGFRFSVLFTSRDLDVRAEYDREEYRNSILSKALKAVKSIDKDLYRNKEEYRDSLEEVVLGFNVETSKYNVLVRTIVMVAPLLGLLGTVDGMIETFDSLGDAKLFSQGGGIAGGISQALITTQLGLVVAIPGLLIGRWLNRIEVKLGDDFTQLVEISSMDYEGN